MKNKSSKKSGLTSMIHVAVMTSLLLLSGCAGRNADFDMVRSMSNGTIDHQEKITSLELFRLLTEHFGKVFIKLSDTHYTLPDNGKVAQLSKIQHNKDWDCDDYAIAAMVPLRNYAFGTMYVTTAAGSKHVMNVFVNRNREIVYWEAQTNQYYAGQFHKPELILF